MTQRKWEYLNFFSALLKNNLVFAFFLEPFTATSRMLFIVREDVSSPDIGVMKSVFSGQVC